MPQVPGEPWRPPEPWRTEEHGRHEAAHGHGDPGHGHGEAVHGRPGVPSEPPADVRRFVWIMSSTRPWGTWAIIAICCGVYLLTRDQPFELLHYGAQQDDLVREGQWWRLYSAMFIHFGLLHLFVNMFSLYNIGPVLERFYGNLAYLALYSVCGLAGSLATLWTGGGGLSGGASGAIFGLCGAIVVMGYRYRDELPDSVRRGMTAGMLPVIFYNLLFGLVGNQVARSTALSVRIGNAAHIGGLLAGVAFAFLVASPRMRPRPSWKVLAPLMLVLAAAPFVLEAWALWSALPGRVTTYRGEGFSFEQPAAVIAMPSQRGTVFMGEGFTVFVNHAEETRPLGTLQAARPELLRGLQAAGYTMASTRIETVGSRSWLTGDGTTDRDQVRVAVTIEGRTAWIVVLLGDLSAGDRAFRTVLQSFEIR